MNYVDTFIAVAPDCPVDSAVIPPMRDGKPALALIQYELLISQPYGYTQEDVLFYGSMRHKAINVSAPSLREQRWTEFFAKPQACLRSSALGKRYGWGIHFDTVGKAALYAMESPEYERFSQNADGLVRVLRALASSNPSREPRSKQQPYCTGE